MHTVSLTHQLVAIQDDFDLDKIIESGQCFRPQKLSDGRYRFLSGSALLYLTPHEKVKHLLHTNFPFHFCSILT